MGERKPPGDHREKNRHRPRMGKGLPPPPFCPLQLPPPPPTLSLVHQNEKKGETTYTQKNQTGRQTQAIHACKGGDGDNPVSTLELVNRRQKREVWTFFYTCIFHRPNVCLLCCVCSSRVCASVRARSQKRGVFFFYVVTTRVVSLIKYPKIRLQTRFSGHGYNRGRAGGRGLYA